MTAGFLAGRKVVVTRAAGQAGGFSAMLKKAGAQVIEFPTIETVPPDDYAGLDAAVEGLAGFDYAVFTSVNALQFFLGRLAEKGKDVSALRGIRIIAVGPKTARELEARGLKADIVPEEFKAEGVIEALVKLDLKGRRFLYPRAEEAREVLPEKLRGMGAEVVVAVAYKTVAPAVDPGYVKALFGGGGVSVVTFTSSSTVKNFFQMLGGAAGGYLNGVCVACIGPVTARTCEELGVAVSVVPKDYTVDALLLALRDYFKRENENG